MNRSFYVVAAMCVASVSVSDSQVDAGVLLLQLNENYGAASPSGAAPWLTATFTDNVDGTVGLQLMSKLQSNTEFFSQIAFSYSGPLPLIAVAPANVAFSNNPSQVSGGGAGSFAFGFDFTTSNKGEGSLRFNGSDVINITLSSPFSDINVEMFNVTTSSGYYAAAHVNGINEKLSGKIADGDGDPNYGPHLTAPEPASIALLALGSFGIGAFRLRRKA